MPEVRKPLHVLVAEDNLVNQKLAVKLLEKKGHRARVVSNGSEAVLAFEEEKFDAILMDVMMPEMDGLEATRRIRGMPGGENIPIIAITANALVGDREKCIDAGMDEYLIKPIDVDHFYQILERIAVGWAVAEPATAEL